MASKSHIQKLHRPINQKKILLNSIWCFFSICYDTVDIMIFPFLNMRRVLLKISGEMLCKASHEMVNASSLELLYSELKESYEKGVQIGIVLGGGNIWRGRETENLGIFRGKSDLVGMLATIMNALVLSSFLETKGIKTMVFSSHSMPSFCEPFSIDRAERAFAEGRICFFSGGTGNPFFTTDSASALKAIEMKCDVYAKATTVDGVYDKDPRKFSDAVKYETVSFSEVLEKQLSVMDVAAFAMCKDYALPIQVFNGDTPGNIAKVLAGGVIGTLVR